MNFENRDDSKISQSTVSSVPYSCTRYSISRCFYVHSKANKRGPATSTTRKMTGRRRNRPQLLFFLCCCLIHLFKDVWYYSIMYKHGHSMQYKGFVTLSLKFIIPSCCKIICLNYNANMIQPFVSKKCRKIQGTFEFLPIQCLK